MSKFGVIVGTRGFFPHTLAEQGRVEILAKLKKMGHEVIIASESETRYGAVETHEDAKIYAKLFADKRDEIEGIIVILPNFGDEIGIVEAISMSNLDVPILVQACDDDLNKVDLAHRRDAFCGKISVCNNFKQYNIKYTDTTNHTCHIDSEEFTKDIEFFAKVCAVVNGIKKARIAFLGARPAAFQTVRFSEKLLQNSGITTRTVDMSEILFDALKMENTKEVMDRVAQLKAYGNIPSKINDDKIIKQAKLGLTMEKWIKENDCNAAAVECWDTAQKNFGCATCASMSYMGENGIPCACESDVMGALTMLALRLASGEPAGYLDWNNNYADNRDMCINTHCSSFPKSFFKNSFEISNLDVLGQSLGEENCFGACKGNIAAGPMTFAKVSTDDVAGKIKCYIGEGEFTNDPAPLDGGIAVCKISNLQNLMKYICKNGFEHHVAMNRSTSAAVLKEAFENYMGWDVYVHK